MEAVHFIVAVERADEKDKTNGGFRVEMDYSTCFPTIHTIGKSWPLDWDQTSHNHMGKIGFEIRVEIVSHSILI